MDSSLYIDTLYAHDLELAHDLLTPRDLLTLCDSVGVLLYDVGMIGGSHDCREPMRMCACRIDPANSCDSSTAGSCRVLPAIRKYLQKKIRGGECELSYQRVNVAGQDGVNSNYVEGEGAGGGGAARNVLHEM